MANGFKWVIDMLQVETMNANGQVLQYLEKLAHKNRISSTVHIL
jgi:hypothetical protein